MSTAVETAHPPLPDGKGNYPGEVLPIYGCATHCELYPDLCWLCGKSGTMTRQRLGRFCDDCKTMKPHVHWHKFDAIALMREPHFFSGHMCEIADLNTDDLEHLPIHFEFCDQHIFAPFTHRPMEFYSKYPKWPKNVWCCGTFTSGEIAFPPGLECGMRVAYCEPVMGKLELFMGGLGMKILGNPQWLVIGLLNHAKYAKLGITLEQLAGWVKDLIADADALGIPIFCKKASDQRWRKMGIKVRQEWPKFPTPPEENWQPVN